jgi:hypothetical protein
MINFDLSKLNGVSFERLIRALGFSHFGPLGTVFSSGPDGGRDFTFEGNIPKYEPREWNGYLVIQAKYLERTTTPENDVAWLIKQLKSEYEKYIKTATVRRPSYYIIATNVSLSGADGNAKGSSTRSGSHTKVHQYLEEWKKSLGLLDFDIWPHDKIIDLLASESNKSIRKTYAAWITPGDILYAILEKIEFEKKSFAEASKRALRIQLKKDRYAKLRDAGSVADHNAIRTSQVFIDLPFSHQRNSDTQSNKKFRLNLNKACLLSALVSRSREKLDAETLSDQSNEDLGPRNKIVILGGPGQGKSTASMFLAQLFRSVILADIPSTKNDAEVSPIIKEITSRAENESISLNFPHRYPILISLPQFADAVSKAKSEDQPSPSLLARIAKEFGNACEESFSVRDVRAWLKEQPAIIILDGLDEVPPSGERTEVIEAIGNLTSEAVELNADILFIVTTRPQGYNNDLSKGLWEHWSLESLSTERALSYAKALGLAQYPNDEERREVLLEVIAGATLKPATQRLLESPLQVTILYLIVDIGGSVPSARWGLFFEYFEVLKKREKGKGGPNQKIIEKYLSSLSPIHQRAGLVLHTDAEHAGAAFSAFDKVKFKALLKNYLLSCGYSNEESTKSSDELYLLAINRLVLLATKEEGKITFDVRSLQEFMAAAALTSGSADVVEARMRHIARMSHWRHVFLIAASRTFTDDTWHHLRTTVATIPRDIEATHAAYQISRSGAKLSLEMFCDGIGVDHPISRRILAQHAMELLTLGPAMFEKDLYILAEDATDDLISTSLRERIVNFGGVTKSAAWLMLLGLALRKPEKYLNLVEELWPSDPNAAASVALDFGNTLPSDRLNERAIEAIALADPIQCASKLSKYINRDRHAQKSKLPNATDKRRIKFVDSINVMERECFEVLMLSKGSVIKIEVVKIFQQQPRGNFLTSASSLNKGWLPLRWAVEFSTKPSPTMLYDFLRKICEGKYLPEAKQFKFYFPWPLALLIDHCGDYSELSAVTEIAKDGGFGKLEDWLAAESRWAKNGATSNDIGYFPKNGMPFDTRIGEIGAPAIGTITIRTYAGRLQLAPKPRF